ncbi:MAG: TIGR03560 family F420-dependent LLM class oxidoreductase [Acidimicrobiia bacterium]
MELRLPAPCLVVLIGASSSGKSSWAATTFRETEIVSSDRLRGMVGAGEDDQQAGTAAFSILEQIVTERMRRRLTTVVDTLGFDRNNRRRWAAQAHEAGLPAFAVVFDTPADQARARNTERPRPIPKSVLDKQLSRFRAVRAEIDDDGFDRVIVEQPLALVAPSIAVAKDEAAEDRSATAGHRFGLVINRFDWDEDRSQMAPRLASIASRAEAAGFDDLWVMDHFRQIPQVGRQWEDIPEAYTALAFLAGVTRRIRLGALVTGIGHRHPVVLGKTVATLDVLSGGRVNLGLGIGWDRAEHEGYGIPFPPVPARYEQLEDTLRMLPLLWGKGSPSFAGTTFSAPELICYPRPIQDPIPILIGGSGEKRTLRLVARYADACNLFGRPDAIRRKVGVLHQHCAEVERDPAEVEVSHLVNVMTAADRETLRERVELLRGRNVSVEAFMARHNAGTIEDQLDHMTGYQTAGASHSMVAIPDVHLDGSIEAFGEVIEGMHHP